MNAKKVKKLRKIVYGKENFRRREYFTDDKGQVTADAKRRRYQELKEVRGK